MHIFSNGPSVYWSGSHNESYKVCSVQCSLTIMRHPHSKAFLKPTVLTFISTFFVDPTVKITPIINKLQSDCSPEETLQRDNEKEKHILGLRDIWKEHYGSRSIGLGIGKDRFLIEFCHWWLETSHLTSLQLNFLCYKIKNRELQCPVLALRQWPHPTNIIQRILAPHFSML